jgi:hypothetical protein
LEDKICNLNHYLVKLLRNIGFYCLIILGEVSKDAIFISFLMVMVHFLIHVTDYEISCFRNPRSKGLHFLDFTKVI